jgi:sporulation protein YlmC with PRC-barrel domain
MRRLSRFAAVAALVSAPVVGTLPLPARGQDRVELVVPEKVVATGIRASRLTGKDVVNERRERLGTIDDFIFGRDDHAVFAVIAVGDTPGLGQLVAVPMKSLVLNEPSGQIVLPGATRAALAKLPVFKYGG